eukprot:scaffold64818_cov72-Phaeocystis_antarctica.AAC.1
MALGCTRPKSLSSWGLPTPVMHSPPSHGENLDRVMAVYCAKHARSSVGQTHQLVEVEDPVRVHPDLVELKALREHDCPRPKVLQREGLHLNVLTCQHGHTCLRSHIKHHLRHERLDKALLPTPLELTVDEAHPHARQRHVYAHDVDHLAHSRVVKLADLPLLLQRSDNVALASRQRHLEEHLALEALDRVRV